SHRFANAARGDNRFLDRASEGSRGCRGGPPGTRVDGVCELGTAHARVGNPTSGAFARDRDGHTTAGTARWVGRAALPNAGAIGATSCAVVSPSSRARAAPASALS